MRASTFRARDCERERYDGRGRARYDDGRCRARYDDGRCRARYDDGRCRARYDDGRGRARYDDRGSVLLEFTGFLPTLLLVGLAVVQLGLVGYSFQQAGSGARAAARAESLEPGAGQGAADAAMSAWYEPQVAVGGTALVRAEVTVDIPTLVPFVDLGWTATRTVTMPADED
ncbi:TadE/TadG family type IV pilus assembly protein [Streptomyces sp. B-S-A8]|uniref:TadE/TadG family type IV pilus assembly protein n=1 Tax=Streptomyces solicavernae TaxID=3043614 RepID=A0ABT6S147_9ACTN|nr:TadE/TadG family type IV pilus assembly protein [Streptomyces sp. B-S-A8]MDI3390421.1 TadE/TadG family type IV pilus assembly protein [Streptomyces sp. B-S-A8]